MSILLRVSIVVLCILFLVIVCRQIALKRLLLRYAFLWLGLAVVIMLAAIFPAPVFALASVAGFDTPSNFIVVVALFFLLAVCLSLAVAMSRTTMRVKNLIQDNALLEKRVEELSLSRLSDGD